MTETETELFKSAFNVSETQSLLEKWDIPITHLDYEYINNCQNDKELEKIVRILRSGQEGSYPELLKRAEDRLASINPQSKYLRVAKTVLTKSTCNTEDWNEISKDLEKWQSDINVLDEDLQNSKNLKLKSNLPEIRKIEQETTANDQMKSKQSNTNRIKSWDYAAWDKYDPDVELLKEDLEEEQRKKERQKKEAREAFERNRKSVSFNAMENLTETESIILADRERELGNECYRAKDYEEAKKYYSNSIKLKPTAAAYNNRCITNIKLKKYNEALEDCKQVLKREPDNIKALLRQAQIFKELSQYTKAFDSLEELISIDPNNTVAQNLMNDIRKKIPVNETQHKTRLKITEVDDNNQTLQNNNKNTKKTKKVIVPIPSTSTFRGPNVKIMEVEASPEKTKPISILKNKSYDFKNLDRNKPVKKLQIKSKSVENHLDNGPKIIEIDPTIENSNTEVLNTIFDQKSESVKNENNANKDLNANSVSLGFVETLQANISPSESRSSNIVEDPTIPSRPLKIDQGSCGEPSPNEEMESPIITPYEFTKAWQAIRDRNDTQSRANVLRRIPATYLSTVISNKLDGQMLSTILKCLHLHFTVPNDIENVEMFLTEITRVPRFELIVMFMDVEDQKLVKNLIAFLKQHGRNLPNDVIRSYGIISMQN